MPTPLRTGPSTTLSTPLPRCAIGLGAALIALAPAAWAQAAGESQPRLELSVGTGLKLAPDFSGSDRRSTSGQLWADITYRSAGYGNFMLDSGSLTLAPALRWATPDDTDLGATTGASLLVGWRAGRDDQRPGFWSQRAGSERLRGLPAVQGAVDVGLEGHTLLFGIPWFAQVRTATQGRQGSLVNLGIYAPWSLAADTRLTVVPTLTWIDGRQARAFYGVDEPASLASGLAVYRPASGWQNAALEVAIDHRLSGPWHLVASVAYQRLLGDACRSPLVESRNQVSGLVGVVWHY